jgi:hypothetical protein
MVCPSLASALDTTAEGIAGVLASPAVVERLRHCALGHETPEKLRFTFFIDGDGSIDILSVEPKPRKHIMTCFEKVAEMILVEPPRKAYKAVVSITFPEALQPAAGKITVKEPRRTTLWKAGTGLGIAGLSLAVAGSALAFAGAGLPLGAKGDSDFERQLFRGCFLSLLASELSFQGSILSMVGLSMRSSAMKLAGLHPSPAYTVLGSLLICAGVVMLRISATIAMMNYEGYAMQLEPGDYVDAHEGTFAAWIAGSTLCLLSLAVQVAQLARQEVTTGKNEKPPSPGVPLVTGGYEPAAGTRWILLTWTF